MQNIDSASRPRPWQIPDDGRELIATDPSAVKIRAEDGRRVAEVDISPFIANLPYGKDTRCFSTPDASGSTSQVRNNTPFGQCLRTFWAIPWGAPSLLWGSCMAGGGLQQALHNIELAWCFSTPNAPHLQLLLPFPFIPPPKPQPPTSLSFVPHPCRTPCRPPISRRHWRQGPAAC